MELMKSMMRIWSLRLLPVEVEKCRLMDFIPKLWFQAREVGPN
jgi:hypothetical protein